MIDRLAALLSKMSSQAQKAASQLKGGRSEPYQTTQDQAARQDLVYIGDGSETGLPSSSGGAPVASDGVPHGSSGADVGTPAVSETYTGAVGNQETSALQFGLYHQSYEAATFDNERFVPVINSGSGGGGTGAAPISEDTFTPSAAPGEQNVIEIATTTVVSHNTSEAPAENPLPPPEVVAADISGQEDAPLQLASFIHIVPAGPDGTLMIEISGLPAGATLSYGIETAPGVWTLSAAEWASVVLTPPANSDADFTLRVTASVTDDLGHVHATTAEVPVQIDAVADIPALSFDSSEQSEIIIRVSGEYYEGWPIAQVAVDGHSVGSWTITADHRSGDWTEIRIVGDFGADGPHNVSITFPNDAYAGVSSLDRNLIVDSIQVNGTTYQAEAPGVDYYVGSTVYSGRERLPWNGKLVFDTSDNGGPIDAASGAEDQAISLNIHAALTDTDGSETLGIRISGVPAGAVLSAGVDHGDGTWTLQSGDLDGLTITPPQNFNGDFTLTVQAIAAEASNGDSATASIEIPVHVRPVNDAPSAPTIDNLAVVENAAGAVIGTLSTVDPDAGDSIVYSVSDNHFEIVGNQLKLKDGVSLNYETEPTVDVKVTATDSRGVNSEATFTVQVTDVVEPPETNTAPMTGQEDIPIDLACHINVASGGQAGTMTIQISGLPDGAALSAGAETSPGVWMLTESELTGLKLVPPANFDGDFTLTLTASMTDSGGHVAATTSQIPIHVEAVADEPAVSLTPSMQSEIVLYVAADSFEGDPHLQLTVDGQIVGEWMVTGTHYTDGEWQEIHIVGDFGPNGPQQVSVAFTNDHYLGTAATDRNLYVDRIEVNGTRYEAEGPDAIYQVGGGQRASQETMYWNGALVFDTSSNAGPSASGETCGTEDSVIALNLSAVLTDTDGSETLGVVISGLPDGAVLSAGIHNPDGSWTLTGDQIPGLTLTPPQAYNGSFIVTVDATATEGANGDTASSLFEFAVHVLPVNDAPSTPTLDNLTVAENAAGAVVGTLSIVDPDAGDSLHYSISDSRFEIVDNELKLKSGVSLNHESEPTVAVNVSAWDTAGAHSSQTFTISVTDVNEAPQATTIATQFARADTAFSLDASRAFSDVDAGDTLTYSINGPSWMTIDPATGQITGTPPSDGTALSMTNGLYHLGGTGTLTIDTNLLSSYAGSHNSLGYYLADANGDPISGQVLYLDTKTFSEQFYQIDLGQFPNADSVGFFLVPKGTFSSPGVTDGSTVNFVETSSGWMAAWGVNGETATTLFSDPSLNPNSFNHLTDNATEGSLNWEDLPGGGDRDYNDVNMDAALRLYEDSQDITVTATDSGGLTASATFHIAVGDALDNALQGSSGADVMWGGGGNDAIYGNGGNDILYGGDGRGYSEDQDDDREGEDRSEEEDDDDHHHTAHPSGDDRIYGGDGNDRIYGNDGNDLLYGGDGNDTIYGGDGNNLAYGGAGIDTLVLHGSIDGYQFDATANNDLLISDLTGGRDGSVELHGIEKIAFGETTYNLTVGTGAGETLTGGSGRDAIFGMRGDDIIYGGGGADELWGGDGNDITYGGAGNDHLVVGYGSDVLDGGTGFDSVDYSWAPTGVVVKLQATDAEGIWGHYANEAAGGLNGFAAGDSYVSIEHVIGTGYDDYVFGNATDTRADLGAGNDFYDVVDDKSGADLVYGGDGDNSIRTGIGDDTLYGGAGADTLIGGDGNDVLYGGDGGDALYGGAGNDSLHIDVSDTTIQGGDGFDRIYVEGGAGVRLDMAASSIEYAEGGAGNDVFDASNATFDVTQYGNAGDDALTGGAGNDLLYGGHGNDIIHGGAGDDLISGGLGDDTMYGGDGSDIFLLEPGSGNDVFDGGAGSSWIDVVRISGVNLMSSEGIHLTSWTLDGQILAYDDHSVTLSQDSDGTATFSDGSTVVFHDIERVEW